MCIYRAPATPGCAVCPGMPGGRHAGAARGTATGAQHAPHGASGHRGPVRPLPHSGARARHGRGARSRRTNSHTAEREHADYKAVLRDNRSQKRDHTSTHLCINVSRPQRAVIAASQASTATRRVQLQDVPTGRSLTVWGTRARAVPETEGRGTLPVAALQRCTALHRAARYA